MKPLKKTSLFWDADLTQMDQNLHADFIIKRILSRGDLDDVHWMIEKYGKEKVKDVFLIALHTFDPKSLNFWCFYFDLDKKACIQKSSIHRQGAFMNR